MLSLEPGFRLGCHLETVLHKHRSFLVDFNWKTSQNWWQRQKQISAAVDLQLSAHIEVTNEIWRWPSSHAYTAHPARRYSRSANLDTQTLRLGSSTRTLAPTVAHHWVLAQKISVELAWLVFQALYSVHMTICTKNASDDLRYELCMCLSRMSWRDDDCCWQT